MGECKEVSSYVNSMNYTRIHHRKIRLAARNEGKIKSYESCVDVRAWSHDIGTRNRYLREWIKCDMPICVVPACTLSSILLIMTCGSRGKVTPRCHSRCQSKVLLYRLTSSCTAIRDCLSNNREFEKYFNEEHRETINWPCEKCLEILKSIKMFWKIVLEKVLKINLPRTNEFKSSHICSIGNIAKEWQKEMVKEALLVKSTSLFNNQNNTNKIESDCENEVAINLEGMSLNEGRHKATKTDCEFKTVAIQTDGRSIRQKMSKCTSVSIKTANLECQPHMDKDIEVITIYKNNIQHLQHKFNEQKNEVDRLKKENLALNVELQKYRQHHSNNLNNCAQSLKSMDKTVALISSPLNSNEKLNFKKPKDIDSEMIITLKNCKNEDFRHVSVIQVLHKTNELNLSEISDSCFKTEDPIDVLNKVHETFAAMVKREISIACKKEKSFESKNVVIKSTCHNIGESKSTPSCCTSSYSFTSGSKFESAN